MNEIQNVIQTSVRKIVDHAAFKAWVTDRRPQSGDIVLINNSFVYRKISTTKAPTYLALEVGSDGVDVTNPNLFISERRINSDFKALPAKKGNLPALELLGEAIDEELKRLGSVVFVLIGEIEDATVSEEELSHYLWDKVVWDPKAGEGFQVAGKTITVRSAEDEEALWEHLKNYCAAQGGVADDSLRDAFGTALEKLQDRAVAELKLPSSKAAPSVGMTDAIVEVLREHRSVYHEALEQCEGDAEKDSHAFNDVLRIAYNFASDATTFLRLIVSVCDLKPIILWATIGEHFQLSETFKGLPWSRSRNKASLENYSYMIGDARNSAFHHLFPFRKSLRVALPETAFKEAELRIFSEFVRKKENQLNYQDKELVEVLLEFTRARERQVPASFWRKNLDVMDDTIELFSATSGFLKVLYTLIEAA